MPAISAGIRHRLARFIPPDVRLRRPEPYLPVPLFTSSPMRQRMQPECEDARKAGTWQLMAAYICKGRNPSGVRGASASLFAGRFDAMINGIDRGCRNPAADRSPERAWPKQARFLLSNASPRWLPIGNP